MKQLVTKAIVLTRTNYGEADRIITMLTPDFGKLRLIAKGVRRIKSKLAGGIELFSESDITFIRGKGEIGTLISARLSANYGNIVKDINRTMLGYDLIKQINKTTEDECESAYFELLCAAYAALNDDSLSNQLIELWFSANLLILGGMTPNLATSADGSKLAQDKTYNFDRDAMAFEPSASGQFSVNEIKFMRLVFAGNSPLQLVRINQAEIITNKLAPLVKTMLI